MGAAIQVARIVQRRWSHSVNRRKVDGIGQGTTITGRIERHQPGSRIVVGIRCDLRGRFVTHFAQSRITIGSNCLINSRTVIECFESVTIGNDALISFDVLIGDGRSHSTNWEERIDDLRLMRSGNSVNLEHLQTAPVVIEDGVWIGARAIILPGVRIGRGSTVGAGSVVTKSVPPFSIAAGNPARVISGVEPWQPNARRR